MTASGNVGRTRSRSATVFGITMRVVHVIMLVSGCTAFAASFISYKGGHPSDEWFGIILFAGIGFMFGIIALLSAAVPVKKNWWSRQWLYAPLVIITLCFLRVVIVTYNY
jgi:peptidoglycan/LPS O-acetylase OafA/YrhL